MLKFLPIPDMANKEIKGLRELEHAKKLSRYEIEDIETFIAHSNAIEGEPCVPDLNSINAFIYLLENKLSLDVIEHAHGLMTSDWHNLEKHEIGHIRTIDVYVGGRQCLSPIGIKFALTEWIQLGIPMFRCGPYQRILRTHILFEKIHPFVDGNGRIGRLIVFSQMAKQQLPFRYFDWRRRGEYYKIFDDEKFAAKFEKFLVPMSMQHKISKEQTKKELDAFLQGYGELLR